MREAILWFDSIAVSVRICIGDEAARVNSVAVSLMGTNPSLWWDVRLLGSIPLHLFVAPSSPQLFFVNGSYKVFIFSPFSFLGHTQYLTFSILHNQNQKKSLVLFMSLGVHEHWIVVMVLFNFEIGLVYEGC